MMIEAPAECVSAVKDLSVGTDGDFAAPVRSDSESFPEFKEGTSVVKDLEVVEMYQANMRLEKVDEGDGSLQTREDEEQQGDELENDENQATEQAAVIACADQETAGEPCRHDNFEGDLEGASGESRRELQESRDRVDRVEAENAVYESSQERSGAGGENHSQMWTPHVGVKLAESDGAVQGANVYWGMMQQQQEQQQPPELQQQKEAYSLSTSQGEEPSVEEPVYSSISSRIVGNVEEEARSPKVAAETEYRIGLAEQVNAGLHLKAPIGSNNAVIPPSESTGTTEPSSCNVSDTQEMLQSFPVQPTTFHQQGSMRSLLQLHVPLDEQQETLDLSGRQQSILPEQRTHHSAEDFPAAPPVEQFSDSDRQVGPALEGSSGQLNPTEQAKAVQSSGRAYWPWYSANPPPGSATYPTYVTPPSLPSHPHVNAGNSFPYPPYSQSGGSPQLYTPASTPTANASEWKEPVPPSSQSIQQKPQKQPIRKPAVPSVSNQVSLRELLPNLCSSCQAAIVRLEETRMENTSLLEQELASNTKTVATAFTSGDVEKLKGVPKVMVLAPDGCGKRRRGPKSKDGEEWISLDEGGPSVEGSSPDANNSKSKLADPSTIKRPVMFVSWETFSRVGRNAVDMELHAQDCRKARDVQRNRDELREALKSKEEELFLLRTTLKNFGLKDPTIEAAELRNGSTAMNGKKPLKYQGMVAKVLALRKDSSKQLTAMDVASLDLMSDSEESDGVECLSSSLADDEVMAEGNVSLARGGTRKRGVSGVRGFSGGRGKGNGRGKGSRGKVGEGVMGGSLINETGEGYGPSYVLPIEDGEAQMTLSKRNLREPIEGKDEGKRKRMKYGAVSTGGMWMEQDELGMMGGDLEADAGVKEVEVKGERDGRGVDRDEQQSGIRQPAGVERGVALTGEEVVNGGQLNVRRMVMRMAGEGPSEGIRNFDEDKEAMADRGETERNVHFQGMGGPQRRAMDRVGGRSGRQMGSEGGGVWAGGRGKAHEKVKKEKVKRLSMSAKEREGAREAKRRAKTRPSSGGQLIGINGMVVFESRVSDDCRPPVPNFFAGQGPSPSDVAGGNMLRMEAAPNVELERLEGHNLNSNLVAGSHMGYADGDSHVERSQSVGLDSTIERGGSFHVGLGGHDDGRRPGGHVEGGWERDHSEAGNMGGGGGSGLVRSGEEEMGHEFNLGYPPHGTVVGRLSMALNVGMPGVGFQGWAPHIDPRGIVSYSAAEELMRQGHHYHHPAHVGRNQAPPHHGY